MEARRHNRFSDDMKKSIDYRNIFSILGSITGFILYRFFKLLMFVIFSPLYIFMFIKNWVVIGTMTSIVYSIIGFLYYSNLPQYQNRYIPDGTFSSILWTDTRFYIVVTVSAVLALIATIGQFSDK